MSEFENASDWTEEWDETYQSYFFYNSKTGESSWERPEGLPESEEAKEISSLKNDTTSETQETVVKAEEITDELVEQAAQWSVSWDDNYQAEFYFNSQTGETTWEMPACMAALQSDANTDVQNSEENEAARSDPANWNVEWDSSYGCDFYYNKVTDESSWEKPACLENVEKEVTREENEEKDEEEKVEGGDDNVAEVVVEKRPSRKNSVMRRPSTRPGAFAVKKLSTPIVPPPPIKEEETESSSTGEVKTSKRRQSLAPRPSTLPPKPSNLTPEFRTQMSSLFANVDTDGSVMVKTSTGLAIIEGDEEDDDNDGDEDNKKLEHSEVMSDLSARIGATSVSESTEDSKTESVTESETVNNPPKAIGTYMMKKSPAMLKSWQKRYVTLKDAKLAYYTNRKEYDDEAKPKGEINLRQISLENFDRSVYVTNTREIHVGILGDKNADKSLKASKDRVLVLQAANGEDAQFWLGILRDWVTYVNA